jgi:hypothetical protein
VQEEKYSRDRITTILVIRALINNIKIKPPVISGVLFLCSIACRLFWIILNSKSGRLLLYCLEVIDVFRFYIDAFRVCFGD